jgi:uncharacterized membrane protein YeaQ/YmgE (transglycosylase-associated protein family)
MHYLYLAGIGFAIGLLARIIMPGRDPMGILKTILLGIIGSYVGAYGAEYFGIAAKDSWEAFGISLCGALAVLLVYKFVRNV